MIRAVVGFDTSNYRTSAAAVSLDGEILFNERILLPVAEGERGLRQNEAVFAHLKLMGTIAEHIREEAKGKKIVAVAASVSPRDGSESYMPVFQVGTSFGRMMAALLEVPFFATTHQRGHVAAAAAGTCLEKHEEYLALHLSGGTTDLLHICRDKIRRIGGSMDLHAGQLIDRTGVQLGLPFPAGPMMEELALQGVSSGQIGCSMSSDNLHCHFSGAETQVLRLIGERRISPENIAREIFDFLARTVARMIGGAVRATGVKDILVTGGIASSVLFRNMLEERLSRNRTFVNAVFGKPEMSGDNAAGVAMIGIREYLKQEEHNDSKNTGR